MAHYDNPADAAMPYMQQIPGTITPYYQPYIDWGQQAGGIMAKTYGQMATDPTGYYNNIMSSYTMSPEAQYQMEQEQQAMNQSAAAGGFTGTPYDQQQQAEMVQGITAKDQQQYYRNVEGAQQYGLGGESHMFDTGYNASSTLADELASNLAQEAGLEFQGRKEGRMSYGRMGEVGR